MQLRSNDIDGARVHRAKYRPEGEMQADVTQAVQATRFERLRLHHLSRVHIETSVKRVLEAIATAMVAIRRDGLRMGFDSSE